MLFSQRSSEASVIHESSLSVKTAALTFEISGEHWLIFN